MRYKITAKIKNEIQKSLGTERGASAVFCRETGIFQSQLSAIMRGKHPVVQEDTWLRLCSTIPALSAMAEPQESVNGSRQSPIAIATTSGANSPATATVGDCSRDCAACRQKVSDAVLVLDIPSDAKVQVLDALRRTMP